MHLSQLELVMQAHTSYRRSGVFSAIGVRYVSSPVLANVGGAHTNSGERPIATDPPAFARFARSLCEGCSDSTIHLDNISISYGSDRSATFGHSLAGNSPPMNKKRATLAANGSENTSDGGGFIVDSEGSRLGIGPATIDANGRFCVELDGYRFFAGEKYTILEHGWAVYLVEAELPEGWLRRHGETRPAQDGWNELPSHGGMLVTSHPVLVALALRVWWHRNGQPISTTPEVLIPSFADAVDEVRRRKILNEFNQCYEGVVPGIENWNSLNEKTISTLTGSENQLITTKIAAWNIQQGGGSRVTEIIDRLREHNPDVVVLSEHGGPNSEQVCDALKTAGWQHQASSHSPEWAGGVLIASRVPFLDAGDQVRSRFDRQRFLAVELSGFTLAGVYFPLKPDDVKNAFWAGVLAYASELQSRPCLLIGDFNTTKHFVDEEEKAVPGSEHLEALEKLGWTECWRQHNPGITEYTWYHGKTKNGFRIDHAYATASLSSAVRKAWYSHKEREQGVSDHSLLLLTIEV